MIRGTETTDRAVARPTLGALLRRRRLVVGLALGAVVLAATALPSLGRWAASERSLERDRLRLATVERGELVRDVAVEGRVVAASHPTVYSRATGTVRLAVQAGEPIERGAVLGRIESPELVSRLDQERSTLLALGADLERARLAAQQAALEDRQAVDLLEVEGLAAERAMERAQRTWDAGLVNEIELERAKDELQRSRLRLAHARQKTELERERRSFELRDAELRVERGRLVMAELQRQVAELELRSPVAGMVARTEVKEGEAVVAGQPLVTVVDLSLLEVELDVPESYAGEVPPGTPVELRAGSASFGGTLRRISPEVSAGLVRARVALAGDAPPLKQNARVGARLVLDRRPDVLKVDRGPFLDAGGHVAYVVDGELARRRRIEVGVVAAGEVEIVDGLVEGETVVVSDLAAFGDAATVLLR